MRNIFCFLIILLLPLKLFGLNIVDDRYRDLTSQIRCVVCQNQSIAESDAPLASDLRLKVKNMILAGKTDEDIKSYLVARYGEFILFKPRFTHLTWFLWLFPLLAVSCFLFWLQKMIKTTHE